MHSVLPSTRGGRLGRLGLITVTSVTALVLTLALAGLGAPAQPAAAALQVGTFRPNVLIGRDDDNTANPLIQPPGTAANQSLNNTDVQLGQGANDVLIGRLGNDVQHGGLGRDILIGGIEGGVQPNSDVQFGDGEGDVSLWAPGDGSDAFIGGQGTDAQVLGVIDRDATNVPTLTGAARGFPAGIPTANLSGSGGFCTLERVPAAAGLGYEFLVRFVVRATGTLAVTLRLSEVEQVFCTSQAGGQITYADLTAADPQFVVVDLARVRQLNELVGAIVR